MPHEPAPSESIHLHSAASARLGRARRLAGAPLLLGMAVATLAAPPAVGAAAPVEREAAAPQPPSQERTDGSLEGRVVAAGSDAPLASAVVAVVGAERRAVTNARGRFSLQGLATGPATLSVRRLGYEPVTVEVHVQGEGRTVVDVTLSEQPIGMDPLVVLSQRTRMLGDPLNLAAIPGSAHFLGPRDLEERKLAFDNVHDVLRRIPGVNVQDEEGYGLRPNIGLRGTGTERSSSITLMEDGVLIAPAPYAAPAAYYFPVAGRMEAVEVRKGSSQVRYGPRTIGGAINLVSAGIPDEGAAWHLDTQGGADGLLKVQARGGGSGEHVGWMIETYQLHTDGFKELQGGGDTGFRVGDYRAKLRVGTRRDAPRYQELELKLGLHDEVSHETYLGLTDADFADNPFLRYPASRPDLMDAEHSQVQLRYFVQPTQRLDLTTTAYRNAFARNWYKLGSVEGASIANVVADPAGHAAALAVLRGADSEDDALSYRANNREYLSKGVQSVLGWRSEGGRLRHAVELGVRLHRDSEDRFQWEDGYRMSGGVPVRTSEGVPGTQANRVGEARARSVYLVDELRAGRWALVPGLRYEHIELVRTDYPTDAPSRSEPTGVRETSVSALIPGLGAAVSIDPSLHVFGGVHRGFAPPGPGAAEGTRSEESLNYEVGARYRGSVMGLQLAAFFSDYRNVLGQATLATGETGRGDQHNGGAVHAAGLEASLDAELAWRPELGVRLPVSVAWTLTRASFRTSFESDFGPWGRVEKGDHLPYLPRHQLSASLGVEDAGWAITLSGAGSSAMRTEAGQGPLEAGASTDAFVAFDLQGRLELPATVGGGILYGGIQNLANRHYIVARRPAGVRPGLPRTLFIGMRVTR